VEFSKNKAVLQTIEACLPSVNGKESVVAPGTGAERSHGPPEAGMKVQQL